MVLVLRTSHQKGKTPSHHGLRLPCVARQSERPSKLALAACIPTKPLRCSNSGWPTSTPLPALLSVRNGIYFTKLTSQKCRWFKNQILLLNPLNGSALMVFGVPICRAEQRRVGGETRPSPVRVPQPATSCVACQGEFRWTPGKPSSTG